MANPVGRPSDYTKELADLICEKVADGQSFRKLTTDDSMPCISTIFTWLRTYPEFLHQYEIAKDQQADLMAEDIIEIADDGRNDWMEINDDEGAITGFRVNGENIQRSRLRVDARKWTASKLKPKKYGEKGSLELSGPGGGSINTNNKFTIEVVNAKPTDNG